MSMGITEALIVVIILVPFAVIFLGVPWAIYAYNKLTRLRALRREGWSGIDVQLKRRHDLVPNLVEIVRGYATFEGSVLEDVARLRAVGDDQLGQRLSGENALTGGIKSLFAVVESYPDLKANKNFQELSTQLIETEDQIQYARRYYNGTVRDLNVYIESFPSSLVARLFDFQPASFFEISTATERQAPAVKLEPKA